MQYIPDEIFRISSFFSKVSAPNNIKEFIADNYFILGGICKALTNNLQSNLKELPKDMLSEIIYGLPSPKWKTIESSVKVIEVTDLVGKEAMNISEF